MALPQLDALDSHRHPLPPAVSPAPDPDEGAVLGSSRFAVLAGTSAAAFVALATWGLTRNGLWLDEAISLGATHQLGETFARTAGTMGPYYTLLDLWTLGFGSSVAALRAVSVVFAAGAVVVTLIVARPIIRRPELLVTAILLATSPGLVRYAQEARSYALVVLLTATSWGAACRAVAATHRCQPATARRWWALLAATSVLGVAAHGLFALQLAAIVASLLVLPLRREVLRGVVPALVGVGAVLLGLCLLGATDIADWVPPLRSSQLLDLVEETVSPSPVGTVIIGALGVWGAATLVRRPTSNLMQRWLNLVPVAWALLPPLALVAMSVVRPYLVPRYVVASVPALAVLVAVGAADLARRLAGATPAPVRRGMAAAGVALVVGVALASSQLAVHDRDGDDWSAAAEQVAEGARPGDGIAFPSVPLRMPFEAAWRDVDADDTPVAVWTARPLGQVRRFDETSGDAALAVDLSGLTRLWVIHQTTEGKGDGALKSFLEFPAVHDDFTIVERRRGDHGIGVILLART